MGVFHIGVNFKLICISLPVEFLVEILCVGAPIIEKLIIIQSMTVNITV